MDNKGRRSRYFVGEVSRTLASSNDTWSNEKQVVMQMCEERFSLKMTASPLPWEERDKDFMQYPGGVRLVPASSL